MRVPKIENDNTAQCGRNYNPNTQKMDELEASLSYSASLSIA